MLQLLPVDYCWELYEFLFSTVKNEEKGTEQFLDGLATILSEAQTSSTITDEQRKLLLSAIDTLSSLTGPSAKRMRKHLDQYLKIFSQHLQEHFSATSDGTSKKDKKFVQKTLAGFAPYASSILSKALKVKEADQKKDADIDRDNKPKQEENSEIDENFRRISKIYIGHSVFQSKIFDLLCPFFNYYGLYNLLPDGLSKFLCYTFDASGLKSSRIAAFGSR